MDFHLGWKFPNSQTAAFSELLLKTQRKNKKSSPSDSNLAGYAELHQNEGDDKRVQNIDRASKKSKRKEKGITKW